MPALLPVNGGPVGRSSVWATRGRVCFLPPVVVGSVELLVFCRCHRPLRHRTPISAEVVGDPAGNYHLKRASERQTVCSINSKSLIISSRPVKYMLSVYKLWSGTSSGFFNCGVSPEKPLFTCGNSILLRGFSCSTLFRSGIKPWVASLGSQCRRDGQHREQSGNNRFGLCWLANCHQSRR